MLNDNVRLKSSLKDIKEILLIRSAQMEQVNGIINDLKRRFPQANITVLAQPQVSDQLLLNPIVKDVILYKEKKFNIFKGFKYLSKIRKKEYDLVVIPYNTSGGVGCSNVEWFSLLVKTRYRIGYDIDGFIYELSLKDYLLKSKFLLKILLNLIFLLFIVVGIKPVSIIKKNFKRSKKTFKRHKKFNIGIDARFLTYGTGIQKQVYNLIKNLPLLDNGFIYTIFQDTRKDLFTYPNLNLKKEIIKIPIYNWQEQFFFPKELLSNKIDLFHGINFITPRIKPCKSIVTIHDLTFLHSKPYSKQYSQHARRWIPFSAKAADVIIAVSESTKSDIIKFLNIPENKIKVVYPGVDYMVYRVIEDFKLIESTKDKYNLPSQYILSVGSAGIRKNHIGIIKAYHRLTQEAMPYKLVFVGRRDFFPIEIFNVIKDLRLENNIIFTGYVPEKDLPILYNGATLFIYPSFFEGFGLPVLEAMACGTPVITSNTSSLPEVAGDAAILVDPYSEEEIAKAIYKVLTDDSLRKDMREKGLRQASKFSWERCARETLEVYKEVLGI